MTIQRTMRCLGAPVARTRLLGLGAIGAAIAASLLAATSGAAAPMGEAACSPSTTILTSPRADSSDVQAKAINDRGDIVGFADSGRGTARARDPVEGRETWRERSTSAFCPATSPRRPTA